MAVLRCDPPEHALLREYATRGYTDGFCVEVPFALSQATYVEAFYTTWVFRLERAILALAVKRPSTDAQAAQLARRELSRFAAWDVEARGGDQLLMCDMHGKTRSWLMCEALDGARTRLWFGSAVTGERDAEGATRLGGLYRALLGFHVLYSRVLLAACAARLRRAQARVAHA
jgi:hypothetical protein